MANLTVSISAEPVFHIGSFTVTNSILTSLITAAILIGVSLWAVRNVKQTKSPKGFQNVLELLIEGLEGITNSITESPRKTKSIFPYFFSFLLFIVVNNWLGLIPGVGTIGYIEEHEPAAVHEEQTAEPGHTIEPSAETSESPASGSSHEPSATPTPHSESNLKRSTLSLGLVKIAYAAEPATLAQASQPAPNNDLFAQALPTLILSLIVVISFWASKNASLKTPTGLRNAVEAFVENVRNIVDKINHSKVLKTLLTVVLGIVILIDILNWTGLASKLASREPGAPKQPKVTAPKAVKPPKAPAPPKEEKGPVFVPYLRAGTADLNTTLALALVSVVATQVIGVQYLGIGYFKKFINLKGPIDAFVGFLEIISEVGHIVSFSFRLFGNVVAGEVLLAVMYFLLPVIVPIPFIGLEIFVGAIQAFVFATLTLVFMNMATQGHGEEHHEVYA